MSICLLVRPVQGSYNTFNYLSYNLLLKLLSLVYRGLNFIAFVKTDVGFNNKFQEFLLKSDVNFSP